MLNKVAQTNTISYREPLRLFEKSGPVDPEFHYYVPLDNVTNTDHQDIKTMLNRGRYFSIFAPRQSGKTTFFRRLCDELHKDRTYIAIILDFETCQEFSKRRFYAYVEEGLYPQLTKRLKKLNCDKYETVQQFLHSYRLTDHKSFGKLFIELNQIIQSKKIIIFIDEFDGIPMKELGNFLTALRTLYLQYKEEKKKALYSIGLVGIRNITKLIVGGVSPFNIADQVDMPPFSIKNVSDLYAQHTQESNQTFTEEAIKMVYEETGGQPWLVNRLGTLLTHTIKPKSVEPITTEDVEKAIRILLKERNNHFDNLDEKAKQYRETLVEIIFDHVEYDPNVESQSWLEQYGLIKDCNGNAVVANNIYKTRYIKTLFKEVHPKYDITTDQYDLPDNRLDMANVLLDFQQYIAQIGVKAFYLSKQKPSEKTGQFLLTVWLYQFTKSGLGDLRHEALSGLGRMDIILTYKGRKYVVETKINHQNDITRVLTQGVMQVSQQYLATESVDEGYLVIFDTKIPVGAACNPIEHQINHKKVISFTIGIGRGK